MFQLTLKVYLGIVLLCVSIKASTDIDYKACDKNGIHFYDELGCKPVRSPSQPCPLSYDCPNYIIPKGKCLFYGNELNDGEMANAHRCNIGFTCLAEPGRKGKFQSQAVVDCYNGPTTPGCYTIRDPASCCRGEEICPEREEDRPTCLVEGELYKEGENFSPEGTCYYCVCQAGYNGIYEEPFCIRSHCDTELRDAKQLENKCAPVYTANSEVLCCQKDFLCPKDVLSINVVTTGASKNKKKCSFGSRKFNVGAQIEVFSKNEVNGGNHTCSCLIPPYLACKK